MTSLSARDKKIIWHPFTQEKTASPNIAVKKAKGSYIYDENNKPYLDLISSWWVNLHGHAHPDIARSIYDQALKLEHVIFAGFTHAPAVELCESLRELLPKELNRFFFSDNGSTSVEVALKMAYQYWHNQNQLDRTLFLSFEGGYHGDTFGAMSVGAHSGFHNTFSDLFFKVLTIPYPETWEEDLNISSKEDHALSVLNGYLNEYSHKIAALILEPLVQGASGMRMCRPEFIRAVIEQVRKKGILVIFDEVMTGFGRTGSYFALEQIGLTPDFLCLSKGITGGFLPLALTVTTDNIYNAFLGNEWKYAFAHGHSYTANPLACAAALASLKLLQQENTKNAVRSINQSHKKGISYLKANCPNIEHSRILGTISAFALKNSDSNYNQLLKLKFLEAGLLIRPLGNTIYILPPYSITTDELELAYEKISKICF
ncbi:adenosylmethionine--8-amino-7-oxononanoate transaminase [Rickettsia endosymbiont of Polydrusus tereticollis]|uniref:adenosylmethionine--8-amino-7-oxononanoate transaminase n=1 Tax=Rickettsia endosymbiont of Polydrusus tereticollis TaxID=3066251 RepID=UPI00313311B7